MRKNAEKVLLAMAVVLAVFIGKGSEAKAYEVVGGTAYMVLDEYDEAMRAGTLPENSYIVGAFPKGTGGVMAYIHIMDKYVPKEYFDYDWYLQKHPELADICGNDKNAIYTYYANIGQANGWYGRIMPGMLINRYDFDYMRYAAENPDVAALFGQDADALYEHYINYGIREGRGIYDVNENSCLKIYDVAEKITNDDMSDRDRIKAVHDWMVQNIKYDYDNYVRDTIPEESYGIDGAMNKGTAVCEGYASTFAFFMHVLGIECETVTSENHAWNKVKVDGEYYYIDVTWDDPVPDEPGRVRYDYYLSKDPTFGGEPDHIPEVMG